MDRTLSPALLIGLVTLYGAACGFTLVRLSRARARGSDISQGQLRTAWFLCAMSFGIAAGGAAYLAYGLISER